MSLPKHNQLENVDSLLENISKLENDLEISSIELSYLIESNKAESIKDYQNIVKNLKAQKDLEAQNQDLQNLRLQEQSIKQQIHTEVYKQIDKSFDNGLYEEFIKEFFEGFSEKARVIADKKYHKIIPKSFDPETGLDGQMIVVTTTKEYDLSPENIKKELADKFTIRVLSDFSSKI